MNFKKIAIGFVVLLAALIGAVLFLPNRHTAESEITAPPPQQQNNPVTPEIPPNPGKTPSASSAPAVLPMPNPPTHK